MDLLILASQYDCPYARNEIRHQPKTEKAEKYWLEIWKTAMGVSETKHWRNFVKLWCGERNNLSKWSRSQDQNMTVLYLIQQIVLSQSGQ